MSTRFMTRRLLTSTISLSLFMIAACGGDGNNDGADAGGGDGIDAGADIDGGGGDIDAGDTQNCPEFATPAGTINSYPGTFTGDLTGAGADFDIAEGTCTDERDFFPQAGEDAVIRLDGLTAGNSYQINIESAGDISFYVADGCTDGTLTDECLLFVDSETANPEAGDFVAPDSGTAFLVVDTFFETLDDGSFTVSVVEPECVVDADCGAGATPFCADNTCVACTSGVHCTDTALPVCDIGGTFECSAGFDVCTGDDAQPPENGDDGPSGAVAIAPTAETPAVVNANICSDPAAETDHYSFTVAKPEGRVFNLDWVDDADDLDLVVIDSEGTVVQTAFSSANPEVMTIPELPAGDYFLLVSKFEADGVADAAAVAYTLTASIPECSTSFDCTDAANPVCGADLFCGTGTEECTGDVDDDANDNDGPAGGITLTSCVAANAAICNTPGTERDYFRVTLADTADLAVEVAFADVAPNDLDLRVFDAEGTLLSLGFYGNPETNTLSYLPAGDYFIEVEYFGDAVTAALAYTVTATVTDNGDCATATDCAAEFSTQIYRGSCDVATGACNEIEGAGALADGAACDSGDDCTSGNCSNLLFQENAQDSVCTTTCESDADCGAGFSCTVPFTTNTCHPDCAGDLECGVNPGSPNLNAGEPWDYLTCTAGACDVDPAP